jgi:protein-S-isoprenylcysteine O-methyltransferase Ste14
MPDPPKTDFSKIIIKGILSVSVTGICVFLLAGDTRYWPGWMFVCITAIRFAVGVLIFRNRPGLIQERVKPGPGTVWWDKVFYAVYGPLFLTILVVGSLDGGRFKWSADMSAWWIAAGACLHILSHVLVLWAMHVNDFFSSTVRIQTERNHQVVDSGPYRYIRHPGYIAAAFMAFSLALLLGSWYAMIPAAGVIVSLVIRTALEDRTLRNELEGYEQYCAATQYKLFPGLW